MNLHLFIYWLNDNIFLHVMFRIELILSCCKNNIKIGLVFIQSKIKINFFPLSFFGHFLYVQTPVLFQVFVKISMTVEIQLIFEVVNFVVHFQVNDLVMVGVSTWLEMGHLGNFGNHSIKFRYKSVMFELNSGHLCINLLEKCLLIKLIPENRLNNLPGINSLNVD
jgi:hypothetical protein